MRFDTAQAWDAAAALSDAATRQEDSPVPDEDLVTGALGGDRNAFDLLVRRHQGFLFRYARSIVSDTDTASDMVQDTLVQAFGNLGRCRNPERFRYWVGRILRNRCLDYLKSAARRSVPLSPALPSGHDDPEHEGYRSQIRSRLRRALAALPAEQREAFLMKHGEDLSYQEMAELAGASVSAMKMRVCRAREALRNELSALAPDV